VDEKRRYWKELADDGDAQPDNRSDGCYGVCLVRAEYMPGSETIVADNSPSAPCGVVFEDDGEAGYFYALDLQASDKDQIVDAVHIYNVSQLTDRGRTSAVSILWSTDGAKSCLLINGHPHAVFDFNARRGYSRNDYPNSPALDSARWNSTSHAWDITALQGFELDGGW